jgi:hypothetical protein
MAGRPSCRAEEGSGGVARGEGASKRQFGGGRIFCVTHGGGKMAGDGNPGGGRARRRGNQGRRGRRCCVVEGGGVPARVGGVRRCMKARRHSNQWQR